MAVRPHAVPGAVYPVRIRPHPPLHIERTTTSICKNESFWTRAVQGGKCRLQTYRQSHGPTPSPLTVLPALTVGIGLFSRTVSGVSGVSGGVVPITLLLDLAGRDHLREKEADVAILHSGCCCDLLGAQRA